MVVGVEGRRKMEVEGDGGAGMEGAVRVCGMEVEGVKEEGWEDLRGEARDKYIYASV